MLFSENAIYKPRRIRRVDGTWRMPSELQTSSTFLWTEISIHHSYNVFQRLVKRVSTNSVVQQLNRLFQKPAISTFSHFEKKIAAPRCLYSHVLQDAGKQCTNDGWMSLFIKKCCLSEIPMAFSKYHLHVKFFLVGKWHFLKTK